MSELPPIVMVLSQEPVRLQQEEKAALDAVFGGESPSFNLAVYGADEGAEGAVETAQTLPMMAARRAVVIRRLEEAKPELLEALLRYAENPNPSTLLFLSGAKLPKSSGGSNPGLKLKNRVKKAGRLVERKAKDEDPRGFAREHARSLGSDIDAAAARLLVELTGSDLGRIRLEVEKAIGFLGNNGTITTEVVHEVTSLVAEADSFQLMDALFVDRDAEKALAISERLLETGDAPHRLLALITWNARQLLLLQECVQAGRNPYDAGVRMPSFKMKKLQAQLRQRPVNATDILQRLAEANRSFNSAKAGDRRVFEGLVLKLVS